VFRNAILTLQAYLNNFTQNQRLSGATDEHPVVSTPCCYNIVIKEQRAKQQIREHLLSNDFGKKTPGLCEFRKAPYDLFSFPPRIPLPPSPSFTSREYIYLLDLSCHFVRTRIKVAWQYLARGGRKLLRYTSLEGLGGGGLEAAARHAAPTAGPEGKEALLRSLS